MNKYIIIVLLAVIPTISMAARQEELLKDSWKFCKGDESPATKWENVTIPHDWAIYGPFDRNNDLQDVAVVQNQEKDASIKTGRTGGLPYVGVGTYKRDFNLPGLDNKSVTLVFDGAMSEAQVEVNGKEVIFWPYGYNSFYCNIDSVANEGKNSLKIRLENRPQSSRWYPGAGLYRNVHLIVTDKIHVPVWGTQITTPYVGEDYGTVKLLTSVKGVKSGEIIVLNTDILDSNGNIVATDMRSVKTADRYTVEQNFVINTPHLWSPETPELYNATTKILVEGKEVDRYNTRFGFRTIELRADKGFFLNGKMRKFQGVCNHHDLGPLGAAVNKAALRRQLVMLKDMGCDAIRTSHNMPAPELVELCDEMGFMMIVEPFDEWDVAKCDNGYHRYFDKWAERDMINMIHQYRNNACVVMWSIGNEVPSQWKAGGVEVAKFLLDICKREDTTRPVTCGMDQFDAVINNGFAAVLDVPGFNYKVNRYDEAYRALPQRLVLGTETASTVSSRGVYKFPVIKAGDAIYDDHQSSSYDTEYCRWSNIPDDDFAVDDDLEYNIGQFVWTGFDYLGEPSPYDTDAWPNHSSMFGIIDLASIPKDRYYLYRSKWNEDDATLHILPHWNWKGREGMITPVFVYTSYPKTELFVNGVSQGMRERNDSTHMNRYRMMWKDVIYQPGSIKVVAYDKSGKAVAEKSIHTAGKAHHLVAEVDRTQLNADGEDLAYITLRVADKDGNIIPDDSRKVSFKVNGAGKFRAVANGDPTCLDMFHVPEMPLFSGALTAIVQSDNQGGEIEFIASAKGVKPIKIKLKAK